MGLSEGRCGWRITGVSALAEEAGVERGDVIVRINRLPVKSVLDHLLWQSLLQNGCPLALHIRDCRTGRVLLVRLPN
jgi:hypothetical protein